MPSVRMPCDLGCSWPNPVRFPFGSALAPSNRKEFEG